ncbi:MAG: hypothetical protein M1819_004626 [Sarea resinae]|nr:MAG: hypothetical protein M1819_004626 [Sarea resinae]
MGSIATPEKIPLENAYIGALQSLRALRDAGQVLSVDYDIVTKTERPQDILECVNDAVRDSSFDDSDARRKGRGVLEPLLLRLERFGSAIGILAQSAQPYSDPSPVGLIWGFMKFLVVIAGDVNIALNVVLDVMEDISLAIPVLETYDYYLGSLRLGILEVPLTHLYGAYLAFGIQAVRTFNRSALRTIGRSAMNSLHEDFRPIISRMIKSTEALNGLATVEHIHHADEAYKVQIREGERAENFRLEVRTLFAQGLNGLPPQDGILKNLNDAPVDMLSEYFIGRENELDSLATTFKSNQADSPKCCAIFGMPGLGKTQLALKYAKTSYENQKYSHVFWISAASEERLIQGFEKILVLINHPDRYQHEQRTKMSAAQRWLEEPNAKNPVYWLLVIDNVNKKTAKFLRENLPRRNSKGRILLTSRTENAVEALVSAAGKQQKAFRLQPPNEQDAITLFLKDSAVECQDPLTTSKAAKLVKCVGYLPLAVDQARALMKQSQRSVDEVLGICHGKQKLEVLGWKNDLTTSEQRSVAATLKCQLNDLHRLSPEVYDLLKILSFFDPECISVNMLVEGSESLLALKPTSVEQLHTSVRLTPAKRLSRLQRIKRFMCRLCRKGGCLAADPSDEDVRLKPPMPEMLPLLQPVARLVGSPVRLSRAIQQLEDFSLVSHETRPGKSVLRLHNLVQSVIQAHAKQDGFYRQWYDTAGGIVYCAISSVGDPYSYKSWAKCEEITPHIQSLANIRGTDADEDPQMSWARLAMVGYFQGRGRYDEAETQNKIALAALTKHLGADDVQTLRATGNLGRNYILQCRYNEAEIIWERVFAGMEKQLGEKHRDTLVAMSKLATVNERQGRYGEAETLLRRHRAIAEKTLGHDDIEVLEVIGELGNLYRLQGRLKEAETALIIALVGMKKHLEPEHLDTSMAYEHLGTLTASENLGNVYLLQHRYSEAEGLFDCAIAGYEKFLGADHHNTLRCKANLASVYDFTDRYDAAETLLSDVLAGMRISLGADCPETVKAKEHLEAIRKKYHPSEKVKPMEGYANSILTETSVDILCP